MKQKLPEDYSIWENHEVAQNFLTGVRSAIPLAATQIDCILRLIRLTQPEVKSFLDLGCGNGILGKAIAQQYPQAQGIFVDLSPTMLEAAQKNIDNSQGNYHFFLEDFGVSQWRDRVDFALPFDVIVSGFAIHHQSDQRKQEIYQEIYDLLKPAGIFLNLEHTASQSSLGEQAFDELFVDALYSYHKKNNPHQTREEIAQQYYNRHDKNANILALVEQQCMWLREIGFVDVDCFMKIFEIALFGGRR